jgi:hypothetical protein
VGDEAGTGERGPAARLQRAVLMCRIRRIVEASSQRSKGYDEAQRCSRESKMRGCSRKSQESKIRCVDFGRSTRRFGKKSCDGTWRCSQQSGTSGVEVSAPWIANVLSSRNRCTHTWAVSPFHEDARGRCKCGQRPNSD